MTTKMAVLERAGRRAVTVILGALLTAIPFASASAQVSDSSDLAFMSLEDLLSMEITTLSRKAEDLADAPAAVHVISRGDIQRSGARTIPDLLRMVPGMQVAQIDGNKWAVTARGNNGLFANKLLVLMDGRNVYSPLATGVFWNEEDTDIANIERIEVIRGPGATMWGANAVNGVVNIITRNAADTVGADVSLLGSDRGTMEGTFRYGAGDEGFAYRIFAKVTSQDPNVDLLGLEAGDSFEMVRVGGRADWALEDGDTLLFTAGAYSGEAGNTAIVRSLAPPFRSFEDVIDDTSGGHALARWSGDLDNGSNLQVQGYLTYSDRFFKTIKEERLTLDLDLQQSIELSDRHNLMWGFGYRNSWDEMTITDPLFADINPADAEYRLISAFIQDDFQVSENFRVMFGTKFENSNYGRNDIEVEPSARFSYRLDETHSLWGAASRAVRLPSRGEQDGNFINEVIPPGADPNLPLPVPAIIRATSGGLMRAEEIVAVEFGYRFRSGNLLVDVAAFWNDYNHERSADFGAPICQPGGAILPLDPACVLTSAYIEIPVPIENESFRETAGFELSMSTQLRDWWHLHGAYTFFDEVDRQTAVGSNVFLEDTAKNQFSLRSNMDISAQLTLDFWLRHVAAYEAQGIDEYTAVDVRLAWQPTESLEVSAVGRNLGAGTHLEFISELNDLEPTQIEPEGYIELRWGF